MKILKPISTMLKNVFLSISLLFTFTVLSQNIVINEICSSNKSLINDAFGESSDWIELYNGSDVDVNLYQFSLSDSQDKWFFPNVTLSSKGYLLLFASNKDTLFGNELHTNFKIKQDGEPIKLFSSTGTIISQIEPIYIPENYSLSSVTDGATVRLISNNPTPNYSNRNLNAIHSSHESGYYNSQFLLALTNTDTTKQIHYTLDGSDPTPNNTTYSTTLIVPGDLKVPSTISYIPTTPLEGPWPLNTFIWKTPKSVNKIDVIKYALFNKDSLVSEIYTKTFIIDPQLSKRYTFPVVSLMTNSDSLFGFEKGIYVPGKRFEEDGFQYLPLGNYRNTGKEWEREVNVTYFDTNGELKIENNAGLRIRGQGSASNPQKSLNVYLRNEYGQNKIDYKLIPGSTANTYKRFILRSSGNDALKTHFKDAMLQDLIKDFNLDLQASQPSIVFINGEYWGIHNIREKYDDHYFKYKFNIDIDSDTDTANVNILGHCGDIEEGDNTDYMEILNFVNNNDLTQENNYLHVVEEIDMDNFIDFQITEIYFSNYDWPCNNYKIWKDNTPDSKWRFLIYDLDLSFGHGNNSGFDKLSLEHATSEESGWPHCNCSNAIFRNLIKNETFKHLFINRFEEHLNNTFATGNVLNKISEFEALYLPEIGEHIERWNYPSSLEKWYEEVNKLKEFAQNRPRYMIANIESFFDVTLSIGDESEIKPSLSILPNPNNGHFEIHNSNGINISNAKITLYNSLGKEVYSQGNICIEDDKKHIIELNNYIPGIYYLRIESNSISKIEKIIIK